MSANLACDSEGRPLDIILPSGWRERAQEEAMTEKFAHLPSGIWVDDDCPLCLSVLIFKNGKAFQLFEEKDISFILKQLRAQQLYY